MAVVGKTSKKPSLTTRVTALARTDKEIIIAAIERSRVAAAFLPEINVFPEKSSCRLLLFFMKAILGCVSGSLAIIPRG